MNRPVHTSPSGLAELSAGSGERQALIAALGALARGRAASELRGVLPPELGASAPDADSPHATLERLLGALESQRVVSALALEEHELRAVQDVVAALGRVVQAMDSGMPPLVVMRSPLWGALQRRARQTLQLLSPARGLPGRQLA